MARQQEDSAFSSMKEGRTFEAKIFLDVFISHNTASRLLRHHAQSADILAFSQRRASLLYITDRQQAHGHY